MLWELSQIAGVKRLGQRGLFETVTAMTTATAIKEQKIASAAATNPPETTEGIMRALLLFAAVHEESISNQG